MKPKNLDAGKCENKKPNGEGCKANAVSLGIAIIRGGLENVRASLEAGDGEYSAACLAVAKHYVDEIKRLWPRTDRSMLSLRGPEGGRKHLFVGNGTMFSTPWLQQLALLTVVTFLGKRPYIETSCLFGTSSEGNRLSDLRF